ncbi:MAG: hypothetical protein JSV90_01835 [Methanobacteriota archaeon]|nr:MAG: hypothetical protein JSV90_01835 [Euryarchaeota archaeon]
MTPSIVVGDHAMWQGPPTEPNRKPDGGQGASWTVALFVSGDNNLEKYWGENSRLSLENLPESSGMSVVALMDWVEQNGTFLYEISGGVTTEVAAFDEMNFGDGATFQWFLTEMSTRYPSDRLAVIGWDHGYAWRYFSDDSTSGDRITMPELQAAVEGAGVFIDVLAFDACNMASIEVVYQMSLTNQVGILVGSEESIPLDGYPYDLMLTPLAEDPSRTPEQLAADMVSGWGEFYGPETWAKTNCLSATDVRSLGMQGAVLEDWCRAMHDRLDEYEWNYKSALKASISAWATCEHVDVGDLCVQLLADDGITDEALRTATVSVADTIGSSVIAFWNAEEVAAFTGLTLYWGLAGDWTTYSDAYAEVAFAEDTGWWLFLDEYN